MRWCIRITSWADGCSPNMPRAWATGGWDCCRGRSTSRAPGNDATASSRPCRAAEQGVRVPDEVSVTGFDNIRWTDLVTPRLTTIAQPVGAIGARAVELMQERMSGGKIDSKRTVFDVELIERDSVRKLNGAS